MSLRKPNNSKQNRLLSPRRKAIYWSRFSQGSYFSNSLIQSERVETFGCRRDMMTDKVRIDTLVANSLNGNNETYLARQAEFESNVRVIRANCRWQLRKPRAFGSLMLRIINILIAWPGRERWLLDIITPTSCKASKMSLPAACRYIPRSHDPVKRSFLRLPALCCRAKAKRIACSSAARPVPMRWKPR